MRLQLTRSLVALAVCVVGAGARAEPPSSTPSTDPQTGSGTESSDAVTDHDLRDVLAGDPAPKDTARDPAAGDPPTGTVRTGAYTDSDRTTVLRALGVVAQTWGHWVLTGSFGVDAVTSASVDVRSSPVLSKVDVMTSASGRSSTSGGEMTDTRYQATGGGGWKDSAGHAVNVTTAFAKENDYVSINGGLNGSYDVLDRSTTLLGGISLTDNWISSVLDSTIHRKMAAAGWSAGVARVLTRDDAIRVRYDGKLSRGYLASPYRNVRFGDWTAQLGTQQIMFTNTIGDAAGLPEREPESRLSSAMVVDWVHSLALGIGLHPELRVAHDSWGINSLTAALDLRIARPSWRLQTGYRFYVQSRADFFEDRYTQAPTMYTYYTSDKELGEELGHVVQLQLAFVLRDAQGPNDSRMLLNLQLDGVHYRYPGFVLLPSRDSIFASVGLTWEL